ncbi:MAG: hypothetical protein ABI832_14220 [bacterium]
MANKDVLAAKGFGYVAGRNDLNVGGVLGRALIGDAEEGEAGKSLAKRRAQIVGDILAHDEQNVIASSEGFSYLFDPKSAQLYHDALKPYFETIKVICYLRRQDQFAVSHHQEGANPQRKPAIWLHGFSPTALPGISPLQFRYLDYATRIGMWADAFGDDAMILRIYDRSTLKDGDSVADFLDILGMQAADFTIKKELNVSMGFIQAKIGHILNEVIEQQEAKASVLAQLHSDDKLLPRRDDAIQFIERYLDGNRQLNARFKISERPDLFSDDFSAYPEEGNELWKEKSFNAAIRACAEVIQALSSDPGLLSAEDYLVAAEAVAASHPETARKLLDMAQKLRPQSESVRARPNAASKPKKRRGERRTGEDGDATSSGRSRRHKRNRKATADAPTPETDGAEA